MSLFNYREFIAKQKEDWQREVIDIFRLFDTNCEGQLTREDAVCVLDLISIPGNEYFHPSKKIVTIQQILDAIAEQKKMIAENNEKRWRYIFRLIAGNKDEDTITVEKLQQFFGKFGHVPNARFCEDFIDEFDRNWLTKTEITMDDWLMFCRIHRLPF